MKIPGYKVYLNSRNRRGGGVAIAVKSNIEHSFYKSELYSNIEFVSVKLTSGTSDLIVGQVYKPPSKVLLHDDLNSLFTERNMIIMGDLNCKRKEWNCLSDNSSGTVLLNFCMDNNIVIAAPLSATNFPTIGTPSVLDIFLLKSKYDHNVPIAKTRLSSDHNPVELKIAFSYKSFKPLVSYDYAKADWPNFKNDLNDLLNLNFFIQTKDEVETQTCLLSEAII